MICFLPYRFRDFTCLCSFQMSPFVTKERIFFRIFLFRNTKGEEVEEKKGDVGRKKKCARDKKRRHYFLLVSFSSFFFLHLLPHRLFFVLFSPNSDPLTMTTAEAEANVASPAGKKKETNQKNTRRDKILSFFLFSEMLFL